MDESDLREGSSEDSDCSSAVEEGLEVNVGDGELMSDSTTEGLSGDCLSDSSSESDSFGHVSDTTAAGGGDGVPLYPDSCITDDSLNTMFLSLVQRHNLTYASQFDILRFFSLLLPSPSKVPSSSHMPISKFVNFKEDTIIQHFCGFCTHALEPGSSSEWQQCI